jgi:hypothetical protein
MQFCEASRCALVAQPANTWSSFGFVLVGVWIIAAGRSQRLAHSLPLGATAIFVGLGSAAYHATNAYVPELLDLASMFLLSSLFVVINLRRAFGWPPWALALTYAGLNVAALGLTVADVDWGDTLFGAQLVLAGVLEALLFRRAPRWRRYTWAGVAVLLFGVGYGCWCLDYYKIVCIPTNGFINGHAIWHLLDAGAVYALHRFYRAEMV